MEFIQMRQEWQQRRTHFRPGNAAGANINRARTNAVPGFAGTKVSLPEVCGRQLETKPVCKKRGETDSSLKNKINGFENSPVPE